MPSSPSVPPPLPTRRVIVVGAGVAGLSCAQELSRSPFPLEVVVLEARNRTGGRVITHWLTTEDPNAPIREQDGHNVQPLPPHPSFRKSEQPATQPTKISDLQQWSHQGRQRSDSALSKPSKRSSPRRHAFSDLSSGSVVPSRISPSGTSYLSVDIGASIMHGCGDNNQLVFKRAISDRIRAPVVAGGGFYESTEHAVWFDDSTGNIIPTEKIVEVHNIFFMASRYMAAVASQSDDGAANMQSIFECGVQYVCEQMENRVLTSVELSILKKICARSVGYCSRMSVMALMQASAGLEVTSADAHIGITYEEDDPPFPGEVPSMSAQSIRHQAARLQRSIVSTQKTPKNMIASKKGGPGDRIVLDGYTPFLIDRLKEGIDVRLNQSVCGVSKAVKVPSDPGDFVDDFEAQVNSSRVHERSRGDEPMSSWRSDPETASRTILVSTRSGEVYQGDFVVITIPLGVLQQEHEESSVSFSPPLSEGKQEAIRCMGMGVHNKVVLRFREEDVFWPEVPQLNCLDPRFQFFNLHSYGKTGVILVHVFAESGFADGYCGLTDEGVVAEILIVLGGMFCIPVENGNMEELLEVQEASQASKGGSKVTYARRRVSLLLSICENCKRPLKDLIIDTEKKFENLVCKACGFTTENDDGNDDDDSGDDSTPKRSERSARLREKAEKESEAKPILVQNDNEDELLLPQNRLTWQKFPAPEEYLVTRWQEDPFSLGSYSFMPCGSTWGMIDQMAAPEPHDSVHPYIFFAGEHCSDMGWQCVHGANETGVRAAREIMACLNNGVLPEFVEDAEKEVETPPAPGNTKQTSPPDSFWTEERERALTRALVGYSDVYGNLSDVFDEIAFALQSFKKEPTNFQREQIRDLVRQRIRERAQDEDIEAKSFLRFHTDGTGVREEVFPRPFEEVHKRPRLVGLNGSKLREKYSNMIVSELRSYAIAVSENQISYRETLRKIAVMIYKKDGGLMTKRCLSEYLRTQEFGTGPQKELFLEKYLDRK